MISIKVECNSCGGTGLYQGFMEGKDEAVICCSCGGNGFCDLKFKEFTKRKHRNGVKRIRGGSGSIIDNPKSAKWISYKEFETLIKTKK